MSEGSAVRPAEAGGDDNMRKVLAVTLICILALLFTSVGTVSAKPKEIKFFRCDQRITFDSNLPDPHWIGTLRDCDLKGKVEYWETDQNYVSGDTEYFFEIFKITTNRGVINGVDNGVWSFTTFKFSADGHVTSATGFWKHLVGYKFHEKGVTTSPDLPNPDFPVIYGTGTMSLIAH
jgi:hypothetical protein